MKCSSFVCIVICLAPFGVTASLRGCVVLRLRGQTLISCCSAPMWIWMTAMVRDHGDDSVNEQVGGNFAVAHSHNAWRSTTTLDRSLQTLREVESDQALSTTQGRFSVKRIRQRSLRRREHISQLTPIIICIYSRNAPSLFGRL